MNLVIKQTRVVEVPVTTLQAFISPYRAATLLDADMLPYLGGGRANPCH